MRKSPPSAARGTRGEGKMRVCEGPCREPSPDCTKLPSGKWVCQSCISRAKAVADHRAAVRRKNAQITRDVRDVMRAGDDKRRAAEEVYYGPEFD